MYFYIGCIVRGVLFKGRNNDILGNLTIWKFKEVFQTSLKKKTTSAKEMVEVIKVYSNTIKG